MSPKKKPNDKTKVKRSRNKTSEKTRKVKPIPVLPSLPSCNHEDKGLYCSKLSRMDIADFQRRFYDFDTKVKQDIFILRHCAVSAPKRCRSKDGIQRKSHIMHFHISPLSGSLVPVCRKTFTEILGIRHGRVHGVITRYIESKKIPTENRGGNRQSEKYKKKFQAVYNFILSLQGVSMKCLSCGADRIMLPSDQDIRKLWSLYVSNTPLDLRVVESYFRNVFTKHFNIGFGNPSDKKKDQCNKCPNRAKVIESSKKVVTISDKEYFDLKMLEMSYPPGEHYLFAPLPSNREPIKDATWRDGDQLFGSTEDTTNQSCENDNKRVTFESTQGSSHQINTSTNCDDQNFKYRVEDYYLNKSGSKHFTPPNHPIVSHSISSNHIRMNALPQQCGSKYQDMNNMPPQCGNVLFSSILTNQYIHGRNDKGMHLPSSGTSKDSLHYTNAPHQAVCGSADRIYLHNPHNTVLSMAKEDVSNKNMQVEPKPVAKKKPVFKCVPCKLKFTSQVIFDKHKECHLKSNELVCKTCDITFSRQKLYDNHMKIHSEKPYKCSRCPKAFNHEINLQIHTKREHDIKNVH